MLCQARGTNCPFMTGANCHPRIITFSHCSISIMYLLQISSWDGLLDGVIDGSPKLSVSRRATWVATLVGIDCEGYLDFA